VAEAVVVVEQVLFGFAKMLALWHTAAT